MGLAHCRVKPNGLSGCGPMLGLLSVVHRPTMHYGCITNLNFIPPHLNVIFALQRPRKLTTQIKGNKAQKLTPKNGNHNDDCNDAQPINDEIETLDSCCLYLLSYGHALFVPSKTTIKKYTLNRIFLHTGK